MIQAAVLVSKCYPRIQNIHLGTLMGQTMPQDFGNDCNDELQ